MPLRWSLQAVKTDQERAKDYFNYNGQTSVSLSLCRIVVRFNIRHGSDYGQLLQRIPVEIICEICGNLSNEDLKKVVLCNRALNEVATPIMYKRSKLSTLKALFMWSEEGFPKDYAANVFLDPEKNKDADKKFNDFLAKLVR